MRSRGEWRLGLERAARAGAIATIAVLAWRVGVPRDAEPVAAPGTGSLGDALARATRARTPVLDLTLDSLPGGVARAWASAIGAAGTRLLWRAADSLPAGALSAEPITEPQGGVRLTVSTPAGTTLRIADSIGVVDSVRSGAGATVVVDAMTVGPVRAESPRGTYQAAVTDSVVLRPVLVLARAGWEGRFAAAALEEAGWRVEVDFAVTDGSLAAGGASAGVRTAAATAPIDTSRYAAVVALDETARPRAEQVARFVRAGGGVVLGAGAAAVPALAAISPARPAAPFTATLGGLASAAPRSGLPGRSLAALRADAIVLERRGPGVTVAARREMLGRVVMIGYDETWRWRLQGGPQSPDEHRGWWSGLVGSVVRAVLVPRPQADAADPAPLAALVSALGPPSAGAPPHAADGWRWDGVLLALCLALLLTEWLSRRTRGLA